MYNKVNWCFSENIEDERVSPLWCKWINQIVGGVKVNDERDHYFQSKKGLRPHLSYSFFFNSVAEMLAILIERTKENGSFEGVIPHRVDNGLSILQYDDNYLFYGLVLSTSEQLFGLKINFHKVSFFYGKAKTMSRSMHTFLVGP